jgi:predicted RNA-binding protein with TRAM domain
MNGQATVYVDSVAVGSVDTYAPTKGFLQALFSVAWGSAYGTHTVKVVNAATSGHPQLQLDAVMSLFGATPAASSAVSAVAGNTSAAVSWTAVKGGTTPVLTYVAAAIDQTNPANGGQTCSTAPPTTSCTINGLVDGDSYVFTVTAQNVYGDGNPSASSVAVIPGTPGIPTNVKAKPLASSASVSWTAPNPGGAAISGYTVFWTNTTTRKSGSQACPGSATTCLIKPLVKGDKYTFSVAATNTYGTGPASPATAAVKIT